MNRKFVFLLSIAFIYSIFSAGYIDTIDANPSVRTAAALIEDQSFAVHPGWPDEALYYRNSHGRLYSKIGLAMPAIYLAPVLLARFAKRWIPVPDEWLEAFFVSWVNIWITSLVIGVLYLFLRKTQGPKPALVLCLVAAFATFLFPYSKTAHREPVQALCLLLSFAGAFGFSFWLSGVGVAVGLLAKLGLLAALLPPLFLSTILAAQSSSRTKNLVALWTPIAIAMTAWLLFSLNFLDGRSTGFTGYGPRVVNFQSAVWYTPFLEGVYRQWLSWRQGIFVYNPVLLLVPVAWAICPTLIGKKKLNPIDGALIFSIAIQTSVHAKWFDPSGGACLGPRYLVVIVPVIFLLLRHCRLEWPRPLWAKSVVSALLLFSVLTQLVSVSVKPQCYWTLQERSQYAFSDPHWLSNWKIFWHKCTGEREIYSSGDFGNSKNVVVDLSDARTLVGFNFWWLHLIRLRNVHQKSVGFLANSQLQP